MTGRVERFETALAREGRKRIPIERIRSIWRRTDPVGAEADDANARLLSTLKELEARGAVILPRSRSGWDRTLRPPMPNSVALPGKPGSPTAQERVSWAPELLFAASIRHPSALAALRAINAWMRDTRHAELIDVPTTERSLEIFGDEKRLDTLRDSGADTLFNGRLKLSDLRCYRVPPLLVWEAQQSPYPDILIVENSSAYDSFRRFNKEAKLWRAVVYGSGAAFLRSHEGLDVVLRHCRAQRLLYFGDLDPEGVRILFKVTEARKSCGLPDIVPHPGLYRALIQRRAVRHAENGPEINSRTAEALKTLLPGEADKVLSLWRQGVVLPQEGMGYAALRGDPAAAAVRLEYGNSSGSARQIPPEQGAPPY